MKVWTLLSAREKKIAVAVAVIVGLVLVDLLGRAWSGVLAGLSAKEAALKKDWAYSSALIARGPSIEDRFAAMKSAYPRLFEEQKDMAKIMSELDDLAKVAGVQVNRIQPNHGGKIEMSLRGSWPQFAKFFQMSEDHEHLFRFSVVNIDRQEPS